ncbi:CUB and sushi domain-containing protein 3-like [Oratosquilla oratoria]|uniref:CUB and sushi domain-containing protein 3-like n=1 Tax=Oratosquilla oratoria TaxID=337810 RepID=UPI003F7580DD
MRGRYVYVQMASIEPASLSLCEVQVYSTEEFAKDRCDTTTLLDELSIFNNTCYEFQVEEGGSFDTARTACKASRGDLVHGIRASTYDFLKSELDRRVDKMKTKLLWVGAQKEPQYISRTWRWVDDEVVEKPPWGRDQPNNYNGKQDCVVLDGGHEWQWNDVGCDLNYLHWICQFKPTTCGSPDRNENTTVTLSTQPEETTATYNCPKGNRVVGTSVRTCLDTGYWSDEAPTCLYVDCGQLSDIENGKVVLVDNRTTYGSRAVYECQTNYTLAGDEFRTCGDGDAWTGEAPQCLYGWCPVLESPPNGAVAQSGRRSGDTATFTCTPGYRLIGAQTVSCMLGGQWSDVAPVCRFVDCGVPEDTLDGQVTLVNGTTFLNSVAAYECGEDFWLDGPEHRVCLSDGRWSGVAPICMLMSCSEPVAPHDGYITGYSLNVHEEIVYHCEPGHYLTGDKIRVCQRSGEWSGDTPTCTYVDCGHVTPPIKGEVKYDNDTTYLGSTIEYECIKNHRLEGDLQRVCLENGEWSGKTPVCREVRCPEPPRPPYGLTTVAGNDRGSVAMVIATRRRNNEQDLGITYRITSVASYRCERGYVVQGPKTRICTTSGTWSNVMPICKFVDCGPPEKIHPVEIRLLSNVTTFGAIAAFECPLHWRLEGRPRRYCQENGTWQGETPHCVEQLCPVIEVSELSEGLQVVLEDRRVGSIATYSCEAGRTLVGQSERECGTHGRWTSATPRCEAVSCPQPQDILNGRVFRLNESLEYGSLVEYHCFPGYKLNGPYTRKCASDGVWSLEQPECTLDDEGVPVIEDNTLEASSNSARGTGDSGALQEEASYTGLYVGLAVAFIGVIFVALAFMFFRTRQHKDADGTLNHGSATLAGTKPREDPQPEVMSYASLSDPTTGNNIYENIHEDEGEEYADMSSGSYTSSPTPAAAAEHTYSNSAMEGENNTYATNGRPISTSSSTTSPFYSSAGDAYDVDMRASQSSMQRPRMPPPQPPVIPPGALVGRGGSKVVMGGGPGGVGGSVVTINGVAVNSH